MTSMSTNHADEARSTLEVLRVAAVTVWTHGGLETVPGEALTPGSRAIARLQEAGADDPVWLDLNLDTDVHRWLQPWHDLTKLQTDWSRIAHVAAAVGLELPGPGRQSAHQLVLQDLPLVNEYAVLSRLTRRALPEFDEPPMIMPLVGLVPAAELTSLNGPVDGLEFVLLRVNLAVIGNVLVTIRLTDRLFSGSRACDDESYLRAADYYTAAKLTVFNRFLASGDAPSATRMGDALAGYLAATCSTVAESARTHLRTIDTRLHAAHVDACHDRAENCHAQMLAIRATLGPIDDELLRLLQRLSDPDSTHSALERARLRYLDVRRQLDSVDAEIRWAADAARSQVEAARLAAQRAAAERQKSIERLVAMLGTALVIAALVPSLFRDTAKLPRPDRFMDFIGMILVMGGLSAVVLCRLSKRLNATTRRLSTSAASQLVAVSALAVGIAIVAHLDWII